MIGYIIIIIVIAALAIYLKSPAAKGKRSEQAVARRLEANSLWNIKGKTLTNVYIPKSSGGTSEIDVIYITKKGLFIVENKNYAGYIFGSESNRNWTVTLYAGKSWYGGKKVNKYHFYNPIWQNNTHIKYLRKYLNDDIKMFSLITFSNRGDLKDITVNSPDVYVCNHSELANILRGIRENTPDILLDEQIDNIYNKLLPLTNLNTAAKQQHINDIQNRFNNMEVCPVCGNRLVLRTAKKGENIGKQFYGCSNYPKCRYTRNI